MHISASWDPYLSQEFEKKYMETLFSFLQNQSSRTIYPAKENWYAALQHTDFGDVKVVILGQDPYHGPNQAHGLSFSVPVREKIPPSLRNIYKELETDPELDFNMPEHGCLTQWADQGVLLLNATLTVEAKQPGSHQNRGWEQFTDNIVAQLNEHREHLVFMLWGKYAQDKGRVIDANRHLVLQTTHPSPFSPIVDFSVAAIFPKPMHG
ncbi:MAG: uracil-DNA glycosylase [Mariprofundus sp.]|nr:uracil-DNA glycosylase [Mariprofundus sp.]